MTPASVDSICLKIGVTAHRDLSFADEAALSRQVRELFSKLQKTFPSLPLVVLNPLAPGGDMLVARVALEMGLSLEIPLPMPLQTYEQDFDSPELLEAFHTLSAQGTVYELPLVAGNTLEGIQACGDARDMQYAQLGMYTAGHSELLLALWDGEESQAPGGAASVVHFQLHDEMAGMPEMSSSEHLLADKDNDLIYHIHCPRADTGSAPDKARWISNGGIVPGVDVPKRYRVAFNHIQAFRNEVDKHREKIADSGDSLLADPQMNADPSLETIDNLYRSANWLAIYYRGLVFRELALTHGLALLMGVCFILYAKYTWFFVLLPAFLLFFFAAWLLNKVAQGLQWHRKYLDNRALAEGLRVQFYWTLADVEGLRGSALVYDKLMQKQEIDLIWIRHVMRGVSTAGRDNPLKIENGVELAIDHWVGDDQKGTGQLGYYNQSSYKRAKLLRQNTFYGKLTLWGGISIAVLLLFLGDSVGDIPTTALLILMGVLPLMAAIRAAYAYKKADKELTKQYQFMYRTFSRALKKLQGAPNQKLKKMVLRALGEACLKEHSEWVLIHRER